MLGLRMLSDLAVQSDCLLSCVAQKLEVEVGDRLRMLSDLAVQCERLRERETPAHGNSLRSQLDTLRADTEQLKTDVIAKQDQINQALKVRPTSFYVFFLKCTCSVTAFYRHVDLRVHYRRVTRMCTFQ